MPDESQSVWGSCSWLYPQVMTWPRQRLIASGFVSSGIREPHGEEYMCGLDPLPQAP